MNISRIILQKFDNILYEFIEILYTEKWILVGTCFWSVKHGRECSGRSWIDLPNMKITVFTMISVVRNGPFCQNNIKKQVEGGLFWPLDHVPVVSTDSMRRHWCLSAKICLHRTVLDRANAICRIQCRGKNQKIRENLRKYRKIPPKMGVHTTWVNPFDQLLLFQT